MGAATEQDATRAAQASPFVRALLLARKNLQLYPAGNPTVGAAITEAAGAWAKLSGGESLTLHIRRNAIVVDGQPVEDPDGRFARCAEDWYRRAVGDITFRPEATEDEVRAVLLVLNRSVEDLLNTGGPAAQPEVEGLGGITVAHHEGVTIVGSPQSAAALQQLAERLDGLLGDATHENPQGVEQFFIGVAEGDPDRLEALQALLFSPERLTLMFQTFALRVHEHAGDDHGMLISQLLRIVEAAGEIAIDLPDDGAQHRVFRGVAEMVRGLDPDARERMVVDGLLPKVATGSLAARILRLFPVPEIANAFTRSIVRNGPDAFSIPDAVGGLGLEADDQELLSILTQGQLESAGALTPELNVMFSDVVLGALPEGTDAQLRGTETMIVCLPEGSDLTADDVRWQRHEFRRARRESRRASLRAEELDLLPLLVEFIHNERRASDFGMLVGRAQVALVGFLEHRQYAAAIHLLEVLLAQRDERIDDFSVQEMKPLQEAIGSLVETNLTLRLLRDLDEAPPESLEADQIMRFFRLLGEPLVQRMLELLDTERSRHVRLLLCHTIAQLVAGKSAVLAARLDHEQWFVARNIMTIAALMASDEALALAMHGVRHPEPRVAREALKTLAQIRSPEAVSAIIACLNSPNVEVQTAAASWLAILRDPVAAEPLAAVIRRDVASLNQTLVLTVIDALGKLNAPAARTALESLCHGGSWLRRRRHAPIRKAALDALRAHPGRR